MVDPPRSALPAALRLLALDTVNAGHGLPAEWPVAVRARRQCQDRRRRELVPTGHAAVGAGQCASLSLRRCHACRSRRPVNVWCKNARRFLTSTRHRTRPHRLTATETAVMHATNSIKIRVAQPPPSASLIPSCIINGYGGGSPSRWPPRQVSESTAPDLGRHEASACRPPSEGQSPPERANGAHPARSFCRNGAVRPATSRGGVELG